MIRFICLLLSFAAFRALAETRHYNLTVRYATASVDGEPKHIITVNDQMPGPLIWANEGDQLIISVTNELYTAGIAIHWHGQRQYGTPYMDGTTGITQCPINPHETFVYNFTASNPGTFWYHSHSDAQYPDGLLGPLIVYAKKDPWAGQYDEQIILVLQDWFRISGENMVTLMKQNNLEVIQATPYFGLQTAPSYLLASVLINGMGWHYAPQEPTVGNVPQTYNTSKENHLPKFKVQRGKRYLVRVINGASIANLQVYITNHTQKIVEIDSIPIKPVISQTGLKLEVGQRCSFIFTADQPVGNYFIQVPLPDVHGLVYQWLIGLGVLQYEGAPESFLMPNSTGYYQWPDLPVTPYPDVDLATQLVPLTPRPPPKATKSFTLVIDHVDQYFTLNGKSFMHPNNNYMVDRWLGKSIPEDIPHIDINYGDVVEIILINQAFGPVAAPHPFHLHGHDFWVIGYGYGEVNESQYNNVNPTYRDTQVVPITPPDQKGWLNIRFVADNPGVWHFHCHMEWHLSMGLAIIFNEALDRLPPPPAHMPMCGVTFQDLYGAPQPHHCSVNISQSSVTSWGDNSFFYQQFNVVIINTGVAKISTVNFELDVSAGAFPSQMWSISTTQSQADARGVIAFKAATPWGLEVGASWTAGYIMRSPATTTARSAPRLTLTNTACLPK